MGAAGPELSAELESLGRAFRREARELEAGSLSLTSAEHRGRIVKSTGDGSLEEFAGSG